MKTKNEIRNLAKTQRSNFSKEYIKKCSDGVLCNLSKVIDKNQTVMSYMSIKGEINLSGLSEIIASKIYYPAIENGEIVAKSEDFEIRKFGIFEPTKGEISKDKIDICLVPGVAFSKNMQRIGFGKGYYDKFLQNFKGKIIGITYQQLLQEHITPDPHDVKMHMIITEKNIYEDKHESNKW